MPTTMRRRSAVVSAVALLITLLAGCSDDGADTGQAPGVAKVKAVDFRFEPASFARTAGKQVTMSITNDGKVTHNLSLPEMGGIPADALSIEVVPGKTENIIFIAPAEEKTLEFFCKFHKGQGMTGNLQLNASGSGTTGAPSTTGAPQATEVPAPTEAPAPPPDTSIPLASTPTS